MMEGKCKCPHHTAIKVMLVLLWVSAVGFWWASAFKQTFLWMDSEHFFKDVVILGVLMYMTKFCGCCEMCGCGHGDDCKCGGCGMCK